ncbi:rRNA maturation RNase YbeY [Wenzhouxiangella marina]|uniref:Endoribonuclease YbeY n=1 Tax=Wenzhouxiangella marina TaxID=1579979 RepID=A0A0K0XW44_9GAMM|nr:rRNA maturation RNase YbeY [Wenzhouxiangella marina]AKS41847.1 rRNA maturation factor [Wenzhouxiangella marina]MBB6086388.1 putative rRNA maturation factor [Wenzhouxiangella marina]
MSANDLIEMEVQREVDDPALPDDEALRRWVEPVLREEGAVMFNLRLVDQAEGWALNRQWRGKDYPTNVLSFPASSPAIEGRRVLGDIVLCAPVIEREAVEQGKALEAHWAHLVVHGLLHLLGFDHTHAEQAEAMEAREIALMAELGFDNPYESDDAS